MELRRLTLKICSICSLVVEEEDSVGILRVSFEPLQQPFFRFSLVALDKKHLPYLFFPFRTSFFPLPAFSFGNGGFQTRRTTSQARRPPASQTNDGPPPPLYVQLLPLLILFGFSLLTILPSLFSTPPIPAPTYSFSPHPQSSHTAQRQTSTYSVPYYVNQKQFEGHPIWESIPVEKRGEEKAGRWSGELRKWEKEVEMGYVRGLQSGCRMEV